MSEARSKEEQADFDLLLQPPDQWPEYRGYKPLDRGRKEIRLLKIRHENGGIHGTIIHSRLEHKVEYEALSYCWGSPSELRPIYIDDEAVLIRATLWNFLDSLCQFRQVLPVWLDAICINQNDPEERNWQVQMMGDIYSQSIGTLAWLGEADYDSNYALTFLERSTAPEIQDSKHFQVMEAKAREGAWQLLQRPYWRRLWIVQEVALANEVHVICGSKRIALEVLANAVNAVEGHQNLEKFQHIRRRCADDSFTSMVSWSTDINSTFESLTDGASIGSLIKLMSVYGEHLCQEPKDKIFALRSLAIDGSYIEVDYSRGLGDLLFDVLEADILNRDQYGEVHAKYTVARSLPETLKDLRKVVEVNHLLFSDLLPTITKSRELAGCPLIETCLSKSSWSTGPRHWPSTTVTNLWQWSEDNSPLCHALEEDKHVTSRSTFEIIYNFTYPDVSSRWYVSLLEKGDMHTIGDLLVFGIHAGLELILRMNGNKPQIIGAIDHTSFHVQDLTSSEPSDFTLIHFMLLQAKQITVCKNFLYLHQDRSTDRSFNLHYSILAILAISAPDTEPSALAAALKESHAVPLCRCEYKGPYSWLDEPERLESSEVPS